MTEDRHIEHAPDGGVGLKRRRTSLNGWRLSVTVGVRDESGRTSETDCVCVDVFVREDGRKEGRRSH